MANIIEKLNKIPGKYRKFIISEKGTDFDVFICEKYKIVGREAGKNYRELLAGLFFNEIDLESLVQNLQKIFNLSSEEAKKAAMDIAGMRLLVIADWLKKDINSYINSLGGKAEDYLKYTEEIKNAVKEEEKAEMLEKEKEAELDEYSSIENNNNLSEYEFNLEEERRDCEEILKSSLLDVLKAEDEFLFESLNGVFLQILMSEKGFAYRDQFFRALLSNEEKITSAPFELGKKPAVGTIGNWLKDFIEQKGSGIFNNIVLGDFLLKSVNTKKLNKNEKELVKKLLVLYRNLKFFPESMPKDVIENWQIIPFSGEESGNTDLAEAKERLEKEKEIINRPAAERAKKIAELKAQADLYEARSLERRAIEEEIKKLE